MDKFSPEFTKQLKDFAVGWLEYFTGDTEKGIKQMVEAYSAMMYEGSTLKHSREQWIKLGECGQILRNAYAWVEEMEAAKN